MPESQSRRLAAILAADIAGYGRLVENDAAVKRRQLPVQTRQNAVANTLRARQRHGDDLLGHLDIGARRCWIARRVIVHQVDRARPTRSWHSICCAYSRPFM